MFDFRTMPDRAGKDALAVDTIPIPNCEVKAGYSHIPMWIADMNFAVPESITSSVAERLKHPLFGYFDPRDEYFDKIIKWQSEHNGVEGLLPEHIGYENGVLGGVSSVLRSFINPGDPVLLHSPVYLGFEHVLHDCGYKGIHSPLVKDEEGIWRMDLKDMENRVKEHNIKVMILSSPHNPTGRVWTKDELIEVTEFCKKLGLTLISDEIWSDLILPGYKHVPTQSVSEWARENVAAFYAPSKTFNLAGLIGSYHIIYGKELREKVRKASAKTHYNSMNVLSMHALLGAYTPTGEKWLSELLEVINTNIDYACSFIDEHFDGITLSRPQGTYMIFIDCEEYCKKRGMSIDELLRKGVEVGVIWQDGRDFLGDWNIRLNLALPTEVVKEAFARLNEIL